MGHMNEPTQKSQVSAGASSMAPKGRKNLVMRCICWGVSVLIARAELDKLFANHLPFSPHHEQLECNEFDGH